MQERRVNAVVLEMERKLRLKDELLHQLRAVVMDNETDSEHQPRQKQKREPKPETFPEQKLASSTPLPVCFVDNAPHLSLTSINSICILLSCISKFLWLVYKSDQVTRVDCSHQFFLTGGKPNFSNSWKSIKLWIRWLDDKPVLNDLLSICVKPKIFVTLFFPSGLCGSSWSQAISGHFF